MLYKILDFFYGFIVSLVVICKIFINTLLYNKAKYIIVQTLYSLLFFSGIYFYDTLGVYIYGFLLLLFIVLLYYPLIFLFNKKNNKSKQLSIVRKLLYKYRFLYYVLYIVLSTFLIFLLGYFYYYPNEIIDGLLELGGLSGSILFWNIGFFLIGLFFGPFSVDINQNKIIKKNTDIDKKLLKEFKEKSWLMIGVFIGVSGMIVLLINLFCGVSFCGGMIAALFIPVALISMIIHMLTGKKTLGMKNKDFMLEKLESVSFYVFVISLILGVIFSVM